jgi:uncharacterized protein
MQPSTTWIAGFLIAACVGLTGMGGGSFTAPLLALAGLPAAESVGTAMIFSAVLRLTVAPVYMARRHLHGRLLGLLLMGGLPGLLLGTWLMHIMNRYEWRAAVLLAVGAMLLISSILTFWPSLRNPGLAPGKPHWLAVLAFPLGVETGFSSAGAGALGTMLLLNFSELPPATAVGTDILFGIFLAVIGGSFHLAWGSVNRDVLFHLLIGGMPGAMFGCMMAKRLPGKKIRAGAALIAIVLGLQLIYSAGHSLLQPQKAQAGGAASASSK